MMDKGITKISVAGFKSIAKEAALDIKPLTLLAGANSSGKSSFMQPLLLMKQTLEWEPPFSPTPLLLDGPNIKFTSVDQLFTRDGNVTSPVFTAAVHTIESSLSISFQKKGLHKLAINEAILWQASRDLRIHISPSMTKAQVLRQTYEITGREIPNVERKNISVKIVPDRIYLQINLTGCSCRTFSTRDIATTDGIYQIIHVPGLRGNPQRKYPSREVWERFPDTFETYTASVIVDWIEQKSNKLSMLNAHLASLGLTSKIMAKRLNGVEIEITVGRLPKTGRSKADMVNISDVGFGVSQTLPVLVALLVAEPGQLVYLEQPEIHLHPRAQRALAGILVEAANRGVKVVAETHSSMLLLAVQTLIAQQKISPENVALHWFERDQKTGLSNVTTAELDEAGRFGDWPVDFGAVEMQAEDDYLDAVFAKGGR